jgi:sec-independent protein translocase protein TatA
MALGALAPQDTREFPMFEGLFSPVHLILLLGLGLLLFGKRLPDVGRSVGKAIVEFKKGLKGLEDEIGDTTASPTSEQRATLEPPRPPQRIPATAPKFEDQVPSNPPPQM